MDDIKPAENKPTATGQVMDIQATKPVAEATAVAPEAVVPQPEATTPDLAEPPQAAETENTTTADTPVDAQPGEEAAPLAAEAPKPQGHKRPLVPIIVAVLIALSLSGVAVFAYLNQQKKTETKQTSQTTSPAPSATSADVDETNQAIDTDLNSANDDADLDDNTLSDTNLNL